MAEHFDDLFKPNQVRLSEQLKPRLSIYDLLDKKPTATRQPGTVMPEPTNALDRSAQKSVEKVLGDLDALPRPWAPGSYWHDGVFRASRFAFRIANAPWNTLTLDAVHQLLLDHAPPSERDWNVDREIDVVRRHVEQGNEQADPPTVMEVPEVTTLPDYFMADAYEEAPLTSTWGALDLSDYLAADGEDEKPTICRLPSGRALFYDAAINGVAGEPAAGKSWVAFLAAVQEMRQGYPVVFVDLEDTPRRTVKRLYAVGASQAEVAELFRYVRPEEGYNQTSRDALDRVAEGARLVVIDSTGEALSLQGAKSNADEDVTAWFTALPKHLAQRGKCVLLLDHVAKVEGGRWPIGSQRKLAAISGAQYTLGLGKAFSRTEGGWSELIVSKDRHGTYYQGEKPAMLDVLVDPGSFELTDHDGRETEIAGPPKKLSQRDRVLEVLRATEEPLTAEEIAAKCGFDPSGASRSLNALKRDGLAQDTNGRPKFWTRT